MNYYDLTKIENWYSLFFYGAGITAYSGSFKLSNKFLKYGEGLIDKDNLQELFFLNYISFIQNCFSGNWGDIQDYDECLLDQNLKLGHIWEVPTYIFFYGLVKLDQGEFKAVYPVSEKLSNIVDNYEHEIARVEQLALETSLLIQYRKLYETKELLELLAKWDLTTIKIGTHTDRLYYLGTMAKIQILLKDLDRAEVSLDQAEECYKKQTVVPPLYAAPYLIPRFSFDIKLLENSILSRNKSAISKHSKNACKSGKAALTNSKKYALYRSEVLRLVGLYYWLIGKQGKAVKWWKKAIEEGERLGAHPDLARTYMEIGKRFLEEKSKYKELNGISIKEYLEKARTMFQEMDLQWDLEQLYRIAAYGQGN